MLGIKKKKFLVMKMKNLKFNKDYFVSFSLSFDGLVSFDDRFFEIVSNSFMGFLIKKIFAVKKNVKEMRLGVVHN